MRVINLNFEQKDLEELSKALYVEGCDAYAIEIAIGYLSSWNLNYPFVTIFISDKDIGLTAYYKEKMDENWKYVIRAVFNKEIKRFGFYL